MSLLHAGGDDPPVVDVVTPHVVRAVSFDLLSRSPFPNELAVAMQGSFEALVDALLAQQNTYEAWYENQLDYFLLHDGLRPSDESPIAQIPAQLAHGELSWREALELIVTSSFFNARNPGPDTFVTVVLEQLLGMTVQENPRVLDAGKLLYDGKKSDFLGQTGQSQSDVVHIVLHHPGAARHYVEREYQRLFGKKSDHERLAQWAKGLDSGKSSYVQLLKSWLMSPDYAAVLKQAREKSDTAFVRGLYVDVLRRLPDAREEKRLKAAFRSIADKGPLRAVVARMLLTAPQAKLGTAKAGEEAKLIAAQFQRFLGREPKDEENQAFVAALADPAGSPLATARALVTHWEYLYY